jgi:hypothetical protein
MSKNEFYGFFNQPDFFWVSLYLVFLLSLYTDSFDLSTIHFTFSCSLHPASTLTFTGSEWSARLGLLTDDQSVFLSL